ncbi:GFA family protein [Tardiphaga sp. 367_B4_N1_1]|uniref:GFA family protein n=1 Tax=Tardiphaga sp. 367_B4_N1_1 TaxID=3240777 RepID=UPI003F262717
MVDRLSGGCLCGSIRYTVTASPTVVSLCHCRNCRKQSGSTRSINWIVQEQDLAVTGELATYCDTGESGKAVLRQFCPRCGSPIRTLAEVMPGLAILKAGSLDDTAPNVPQRASYTANAAAWELLALDCPQFQRGASS